MCCCSLLWQVHAQQEHADNSQDDWRATLIEGDELIDESGIVRMPPNQVTTIRGRFEIPKKSKNVQLTVQQPMSWDNWESIPDLGPDGTGDAPILLPVGDADYYYFARFKSSEEGVSRLP